MFLNEILLAAVVVAVGPTNIAIGVAVAMAGRILWRYRQAGRTAA